MFTKLYIDNFSGISAPVKFDFISKSRNKSMLNSVAKIEEDVYINKLVGIIGGNASGKTSILSAIGMVGQLLVSPVLQYDIGDRLEYVKQLIANEPNKDTEQEIIEIVENLKTSTSLEVQNLRRKKEDTKIELEMYIFSEEDMSGFYSYEITFNGMKKIIKHECLKFRKQYKSPCRTIIEISDAKESQVYYINRYYKNLINIDSENKDELDFKFKYCKEFVNHYINNSAIIDTSENVNYKELKFIDWFKNNPFELRTLARVVDPKIKNVVIDTDGKNEELKFVLKDGTKITRNLLSKGTDRFLNHIRYIKEIIEKNGDLVIDEIEQNLHKDLVELMIRLFSELENKYSQLIFTTLSPELLDIFNKEGKRIFKQDTIFVINCENDDITVERLIEMQFDGNRIKGDASVASLYKNKKISTHPDKELIECFLESLKIN